jgi:hypothetical protein
MKYVKTFEAYNLDTPQTPVSSWSDNERKDLEQLGADEIGRNTAVFKNPIEVNKHGFAKGGISFEGEDGETLVVTLRKYSENAKMTVAAYPGTPMNTDRRMSEIVQAPYYKATSNASSNAPTDRGDVQKRPVWTTISSKDWSDFKEKLHVFINNLGIEERQNIDRNEY